MFHRCTKDAAQCLIDIDDVLGELVMIRRVLDQQASLSKRLLKNYSTNDGPKQVFNGLTSEVGRLTKEAENLRERVRLPRLSLENARILF